MEEVETAFSLGFNAQHDLSPAFVLGHIKNGFDLQNEGGFVHVGARASGAPEISAKIVSDPQWVEDLTPLVYSRVVAPYRQDIFLSHERGQGEQDPGRSIQKVLLASRGAVFLGRLFPWERKPTEWLTMFTGFTGQLPTSLAFSVEVSYTLTPEQAIKEQGGFVYPTLPVPSADLEHIPFVLENTWVPPRFGYPAEFKTLMEAKRTPEEKIRVSLCFSLCLPGNRTVQVPADTVHHALVALDAEVLRAWYGLAGDLRGPIFQAVGL